MDPTQQLSYFYLIAKSEQSPETFITFTQCVQKVLELILFFLKNRRQMRKTQLFLIQNELQWHIYRLLRGHTVSEKLSNIPLFGPSLIHQLRLLGYQQHPKIGVF